MQCRSEMREQIGKGVLVMSASYIAISPRPIESNTTIYPHLIMPHPFYLQATCLELNPNHNQPLGLSHHHSTSLPSGFHENIRRAFERDAALALNQHVAALALDTTI
eukprot:scaffold19275_cov102-Skeletonema_marinoi.AAC.2